MGPAHRKQVRRLLGDRILQGPTKHLSVSGRLLGEPRPRPAPLLYLIQFCISTRIPNLRSSLKLAGSLGTALGGTAQRRSVRGCLLLLFFPTQGPRSL